MAQDIVGGIFGVTPEMYQQAKVARDTATNLQAAALTPGQLAGYYAAEAGSGLGRAVPGLLGIEDPQMQLISKTNQLVQQIGVDTPEKLQTLASELQKIPGGGPLAMQAIDKANQMMKTTSEAQTARQKYTDLNTMREELAGLGEGATDKQILGVVKKYGSADNILKTLEMADLKRMQASAKAQVDSEKAQAAKEMGISNARNVLGVIAETKPLISSANTGDIGGKNEIWFTGAGELQTKLDTIKANLSIDKLAQMKEASKTGASGLGSLAVKELETLQALVASLDRKQSKESLTNSLTKIEKHYKQYIAYMSGDKTAYKQGGTDAATSDNDPLGIRK